MSLDTLPGKVRHSALAQTLADKLSSPQPVDVDYWGEFKRLRDRVSAHVGEMKVLFPWFTPHDEEHHLSRLFGIADKMLGPERYERMNVAELFLLACGLYAHDWGMAVGAEEIVFLRSGATGNTNSDVFTPLDDEPQRLREFAERQGLRSAKQDAFPELDDDHLRAYVRHTHAWRSGVRARAFFKTAGASLPQALERVCQGHWLDFSELDDEHRFSAQFGVLGQTVNLRAVALYVRLVDLFDIADDRTPYAIWRFVAPRDPKARTEWSKHRALSPVTFPQYGDGRVIRFDGSTSDPEVWAELEDLRSYCESQLAGTNDLLARHHDERHQLDLRKIEWAIIAERFTPVNIRFEFHRQRMFEILADEIYQGDSHVFLRELLQNSIDAIRMRRELVQRRAASSGTRRAVGLGFDDAIYFDVEHGADGDAIVRCRDNGIGMDEYVIRNYLSMAGVSYYQSDEFHHLGLKMDPISRFGIGLLSCFMVAERIEIETFREPHLTADAKPLRIDIPAVERQFRVFPAMAATDIGTLVTVHVRGRKLRTDVRSDADKDAQPSTPRLQVTEYLAAVAGFVEFPIVIDEDGRRTVILHPNKPDTEAQEFARNGEAIDIRQLTNDYPWNEVFVPQDSSDAARVLLPRVFDLHRDLGLADYEGTLSYLSPIDENCKFKGDHVEPATRLLVILPKTAEPREQVPLRISKIFSSYLAIRKVGIAPSCRQSPVISVYRDGLLVADAPNLSRNNKFEYIAPTWPLPVLRINLPKRLAGAPDVSRRTLRGIVESWDIQVWREVVHYLCGHEVVKILSLEPSERLTRLARLANIYRLSTEEIMHLVPREFWPCPMLTCEGEAIISDLLIQPGQSHLLAPEIIQRAVINQLNWEIGYGYSKKFLRPMLTNWRGDKTCVMCDFDALESGTLYSFWLYLTKLRIDAEFTPVNVRFLQAPLPGLAPLPQLEVVCVYPPTLDTSGLLEAAMCNPILLDAAQRCMLKNLQNLPYQLKLIVQAAPFAAPFADYFAWGDDHLNLNHPTTCALLRCTAALQWHRMQKTRPAVELGRIEDSLKTIVSNLRFPDILRDELAGLWSLVKRCDLIEIGDPPPSPESGDYVWGSLCDLQVDRYSADYILYYKESAVVDKYMRPFGQVLTDATPEQLPPDLDAEFSPT